MIPGTSCLATVAVSVRKQNHSPIEAPRHLGVYEGKPYACCFVDARMVQGR
jgi:hypothetical protein